MWMLKLKNGLELTEHQMKCWDNVPKDTEIKALALALPRKKQPPYIIDITGYEEVCCATMANANLVGGKVGVVGYVLYCVKNSLVNEMKIMTNGIALKTYPRDKLELRPSCLRRMVG